MKIERIITGYLEENCYILINDDNQVLIIDPGDEALKIISNIKNREVIGILITHHHMDHIGALNDIENKYNIKELNFEEGRHFIEDFSFEVINTPGHTKDSKSYYFYNDNCMFTGDFLFKGTIGRTDMEGGSNTAMKSSLNKIKKYDDNIIIYPGHGESSTLLYEKENNIYLV